ncbi:hypothetical protein JCM17478_28540 [Thermopirellula anaerolimosa]
MINPAARAYHNRLQAGSQSHWQPADSAAFAPQAACSDNIMPINEEFSAGRSAWDEEAASPCGTGRAKSASGKLGPLTKVVRGAAAGEDCHTAVPFQGPLPPPVASADDE